MDDGINTQLRTITFSEARKGFDKGEVREFLSDDYSEATRSEAKREADELREESTQEARQAIAGAEQRAEQIIAEANRQRLDIETVIGDLAHKRDTVMAQARKLALELDETVDGLESDIGNRRSSAVSAEPEAPVAEAVAGQSTAEEQKLEELGVGAGLVRNGNGNGNGAH